VDVYDKDGNQATEKFLDTLDALKTSNEKLGAAWRWAVRAVESPKVMFTIFISPH